MPGRNLFDKHRRAIELSGTLYLTPIEAGRGYADGETIPVVDTDWSDEVLEAVVAVGPGYPSLASLKVEVIIEEKTWAHYRDVECIPLTRFPCGINFDDVITTSILSISWTAADLVNLPQPAVKGGPLNLYMEIRRLGGGGPRFAGADFILTESIG